MELDGYPPTCEQPEAQHVSQEMSVSPTRAEPATGYTTPPSTWLAWLQVLGGFLVIFNAQ